MMRDLMILWLMDRLHTAQGRWPRGYRNGDLGYYRLRRVNKMAGLPGYFRMDDHGHMCFAHNDGRVLHLWTTRWYRAMGLWSPDSHYAKPKDADWFRTCQLHPA